MLIKFNDKVPIVASNSLILPGSRLIGSVKIDEYSIVLFNVVLRGDIDSISIGKYSNIQDNVVIHTDQGFSVKIGDYVTIGHNSTIHGAVIESNVIVGMNSIILNGSYIPSNVIIGAGSLVPQNKKLESGYLYVGAPVRKLRKLNEEALKYIEKAWKIYYELLKKYKEELE